MVDNITVKDASGANVVMRAKDVGAGVESSITIPGDATGAIAWGTAGASNANVMSVQGIASGTALPISGSVTVTLAAETTKVIGTVRALGNAGAIFDFAGQNAASPANSLLVAGQFNTSPTTITTGNASPLQLDNAGNLLVNIKASTGLNANGQAVMASSSPVVIASDQSTLAVALDTSQMLNGASGVSLTPVKTKISVAAATTTTVVALVSAKKIRILAMYLVVGGANNLNWQSHTTTTNADGVQDFAANGGIVLPFNPLGWFDTTAGEALDLVTSTSAQVGGLVVTVAV